MTNRISPTDKRLTWAGAVSLHETADWAMPTRIPDAERVLFPPSLAEKAAWPAGVRLSFWSDTTSIEGEIDLVEDPNATFETKPVDLCIDGEFVESAPLAGRERFAFDGLPPGRKLIELWAPQLGQFRLKTLILGDGASVEPFHDDRPKWITYGSSITHCGEAESPTGTWPAIVARACAYNLLCFGFGAECHQDVQVATMIRDAEVDFLSLKLGINDQILLTHNERTFASSIIGFVRVVREKHPDIPIVLISSIVSPPREETPNAAGMALPAYRAGVEHAARALRDAGDANVHFVDGLTLFGADDATPELLPDQLHPGPGGYRLLAERFIEHVARPYFGYAD